MRRTLLLVIAIVAAMALPAGSASAQGHYVEIIDPATGQACEPVCITTLSGTLDYERQTPFGWVLLATCDTSYTLQIDAVGGFALSSPSYRLGSAGWKQCYEFQAYNMPWGGQIAHDGAGNVTASHFMDGDFGVYGQGTADYDLEEVAPDDWAWHIDDMVNAGFRINGTLTTADQFGIEQHSYGN